MYSRSTRKLASLVTQGDEQIEKVMMVIKFDSMALHVSYTLKDEAEVRHTVKVSWMNAEYALIVC